MRRDGDTAVVPLLDGEVPEDCERSSQARRALREVFDGAWPQIVVIFARTAITTTDTAVCGHLGKEELAGAAFSTMIIQLTCSILWSMGDGLTALTSQAMGAGNNKLASVWFELCLFFCLGCSFPLYFIWYFIGEMLPTNAGLGDDVIHYASVFGRLSTLWLFPEAISVAFCQWLNGLNLARHTVWIHLFFVVFNLAANFVLVFGVRLSDNFKLGGYEFIGSPLATTLTSTLRIIALWWHMRDKLPEGVVFKFDRKEWTRTRVGVFLSQAIPNMFSGLLEQAQFIVIGFMIAHFGAAALSANASMMTLFDLLSCNIYGMMEGSMQKIGRALGDGSLDLARAISKYVFLTMFLNGLVVGTIFVALQGVLGRIFSNDPEVIEYSRQLSILTGISYFFLSTTFAAWAILQGQGRPEKALIAMAVGVWVFGVPLAYLFAFTLDIGFIGVWGGSVVGYIVVTIVLLFQLWRTDWQAVCDVARERAEVGDAQAQEQETSLSLS